jgi:hypothetical protein
MRFLELVTTARRADLDKRADDPKIAGIGAHSVGQFLPPARINQTHFNSALPFGVALLPRMPLHRPIDRRSVLSSGLVHPACLSVSFAASRHETDPR